MSASWRLRHKDILSTLFNFWPIYQMDRLQSLLVNYIIVICWHFTRVCRLLHILHGVCRQTNVFCTSNISQKFKWITTVMFSSGVCHVFITARRHAGAVYAVVVCLFACLSQVGVLLKRLNVRSRKQCHTIVQGLSFSNAENLGKTQTR